MVLRSMYVNEFGRFLMGVLVIMLNPPNVQILYGAGFVEFYAEEGKRIFGDIIPSPFLEKRMFVMKQVRPNHWDRLLTSK